MTDSIVYNTLEELVNEIRANGRYAFSVEEAKHGLQLSDKALYQTLFRLKNKNRIAQIRRGYFAIITPEYSKQGMLPPDLFIDDLMLYLGKRYYVGLFSAAVLYGVAHRQPMEYYVITEKPSLRNIRNSSLVINFYVKETWKETEVLQKKAGSGYLNVSAPELTALDLLTYGSFGINRILTILEELKEKIKPSELAKAARSFPVTSSIQRLGYLMDKQIGNDKLSSALKKVLKDRRTHMIPLLKNGENKGKTDLDWKVYVNTQQIIW
jgi:predicted transcriptional regulator of viral defense system